MPLHAPKRSSAGYFLALTPPAPAPLLRWQSTEAAGGPQRWTLTPEWSAWATQQREQLLGELLSHGNWFSKPPRRDILEPLFTPWEGTTLQQGARRFFCKCPEVPGENTSSGQAAWQLNGLLMNASSIEPVWELTEVRQDEVQDTISLFGDVDTVDGSEDEKEGAPDADTREIHIDDIEEAPPGPTPHLRSREWEARKFLAKERVREARLKAQIAARVAEKEESRFYRQFGDLDDAESHFSEYDLTDDEVGSSGSESGVELD